MPTDLSFSPMPLFVAAATTASAQIWWLPASSAQICCGPSSSACCCVGVWFRSVRILLGSFLDALFLHLCMYLVLCVLLSSYIFIWLCLPKVHFSDPPTLVWCCCSLSQLLWCMSCFSLTCYLVYFVWQVGFDFAHYVRCNLLCSNYLHLWGVKWYLCLKKKKKKNLD